MTPGLISTHAHIAGSPLDRSSIEDRMAKYDWAGRGADELSPQTYPAWE